MYLTVYETIQKEVKMMIDEVFWSIESTDSDCMCTCDAEKAAYICGPGQGVSHKLRAYW